MPSAAPAVSPARPATQSSGRLPTADATHRQSSRLPASAAPGRRVQAQVQPPRLKAIHLPRQPDVTSSLQRNVTAWLEVSIVLPMYSATTGLPATRPMFRWQPEVQR